MTTTSQRLKEAMNIRNIRQADLVEKTGINKGALSCYLSGQYKPKQSNLYLLAQALNVNEAWLMGADVSMDRIDSSAATPDLTEDEKTILSYFNILNDYGKEEAVKRVSELSEIDRYKKQPDAQRSNLDVG